MFLALVQLHCSQADSLLTFLILLHALFYSNSLLSHVISHSFAYSTSSVSQTSYHSLHRSSNLFEFRSEPYHRYRPNQITNCHETYSFAHLSPTISSVFLPHVALRQLSRHRQAFIMSDSRSSSPVLPFYRQDVTLANAVDPDYDIEAQDRAPNGESARPTQALHQVDTGVE